MRRDDEVYVKILKFLGFDEKWGQAKVTFDFVKSQVIVYCPLEAASAFFLEGLEECMALVRRLVDEFV